MKTMKVLFAALAVSLVFSFSQRAFAQSAPEVDSTVSNLIMQGDTNVTMTIYGSNLLNSNGSPGTVSYWSDICSDATPVDSYGDCAVPGEGYSSLVSFTVVSYDPYGTWIQVSYSAGVIPISCGLGYRVGNDLGSAVVETDGGTGFSPDIAVDNPNL